MNKKSLSVTNEALRQVRLLQGWSQQDVADQLGTTIITVNRWERGCQQPGPIFRMKLCALFDKCESELGLSEEQYKDMHMINEKSFSMTNEALRKARLLQGWSQLHMADQLGTTIVTVNRWERGSQQPGPIFRLKLCTLFDKSESELGLSEEEPYMDEEQVS